ncbi:MAG: phage holin family protein [Patescibacteria group bacterium]|nr:phage holin family protein [Patescibacteria group bacterium]
MKLIGGFIFHIFSNAIAVLAANYFIVGFIFKGDFVDLVVAALVLTLINTFLRPVLKLFLGPIIILTFGLFTIVINAITLYLLDILSDSLTIQGYLPLILGTIIIGVINFILNFAAKRLYRK